MYVLSEGKFMGFGVKNNKENDCKLHFDNFKEKIDCLKLWKYHEKYTKNIF